MILFLQFIICTPHPKWHKKNPIQTIRFIQKKTLLFSPAWQQTVRSFIQDKLLYAVASVDTSRRLFSCSDFFLKLLEKPFSKSLMKKSISITMQYHQKQLSSMTRPFFDTTICGEGGMMPVHRGWCYCERIIQWGITSRLLKKSVSILMLKSIKFQCII